MQIEYEQGTMAPPPLGGLPVMPISGEEGSDEEEEDEEDEDEEEVVEEDEGGSVVVVCHLQSLIAQHFTMPFTSHSKMFLE